MARKRINKRKLGKKSTKKGASNSPALVLKIAATLIQFSLLMVICFFLYFIVAFTIHLFEGEYRGTNIKSEKISITPNQASYIVGTENSTSIPLHVLKNIVNADKLLLLDFQKFPSYEKGKTFYDRLISIQRQKPGLSIFVIANNECRNFSDNLPVKFAVLCKAGINVVFTDPAVPQTYHWVYAPLASMLSMIVPSSWSYSLKKWTSGKNRRNVIISQGDNGIRALTGNLSLLKNKGELEMAVSLSDAAALPLLKSELLLIREFMENSSNGFASGGTDAIKRGVESSLKNVLNIKFPQIGNNTFEYLSEGEIKNKLTSMLSGAESGDTIDIIAGSLDSISVIKSIRFADMIGAKVRILMDKTTDSDDGSPSLPNVLSARKLFRNSHNTNIQWLEGHTTELSFVHIYNKSKTKSRVLLLTCPMTDSYIDNYNLAGACYLEGEIKDSKRLITLFNTYSNRNATRKIYSSRFEKYPLSATKGFYFKTLSFTQNMLGISPTSN